MSGIKWQEPPPREWRGSRGSRGEYETRWSSVARALRERPGEWALVDTRSKRATFHTTGSKLGSAHGFESRIRKNADGAYDIYVRYVGEVTS